ncbi:MAG: methyltransferase domain-containing protein [Myxococcota bacterium]
MSLQHASLRGKPVALRGEPPFEATALVPLVGKRFALPSDDPFVRGAGDEAHGYLDGARSGWTDHPEYMDFLDLASPIYGLKRMERDLYLHHWRAHVDAARVLDVGAGIGRFTQAFLDRGATVHAVDPDLESLRRLVWHAAGRPGRLDVTLASVDHLPEVEVDLAIAAEVLCYVPAAVQALRSIAQRVRPGGRVLLSVEARHGWAVAQDAPQGGIEAALDGDGLVWLPGDRWVQTYDAARVEALVADAGLTLLDRVASHYLPDGPLEDSGPAEVTLEQLVALEDRCRRHPVYGPLNRLWLVAAERR